MSKDNTDNLIERVAKNDDEAALHELTNSETGVIFDKMGMNIMNQNSFIKLVTQIKESPNMISKLSKCYELHLDAQINRVAHEYEVAGGVQRAHVLDRAIPIFQKKAASIMDNSMKHFSELVITIHKRMLENNKAQYEQLQSLNEQKESGILTEEMYKMQSEFIYDAFGDTNKFGIDGFNGVMKNQQLLLRQTLETAIEEMMDKDAIDGEYKELN